MEIIGAAKFESLSYTIQLAHESAQSARKTVQVWATIVLMGCLVKIFIRLENIAMTKIDDTTALFIGESF